MTHQEFLATVTPPEFRGTAMYTQGEAIGMMAMGIVLQWAVEKAMEKLEKAILKSRAARKVRVQEEGAQGGAGGAGGPRPRPRGRRIASTLPLIYLGFAAA